jgi:tRNA(Arg) A34 adenosine deaminase TadA
MTLYQAAEKKAALIRLYATMVNKIEEHHTIVTVNTPDAQRLSNALNEFITMDPRLAVLHPNYSSLAVLAKPTIHIIDDPTRRPEPTATNPEPQWLHELPFAPRPQLYCVDSRTGISTLTNNVHFIKSQQLTHTHAEITKRRQVSELLQGSQPNWTYSGLILYRKRYGVHITTPLSRLHNQLMLQYRYGGAIKTDVTKCTCGAPASITHVYTHFTPTERHFLELQAHSIHYQSSLAQLHGPTPWLTLTPQTCTGWICADLSHITTSKDVKRHHQTIGDCLAVFANAFITKAQSMLTHQPATTPHRQVPCTRPNESIIPDPEQNHIATTGWAFSSDGAYNPQHPGKMGLGATIFHDGLIIARLHTPQRCDHANSLHAEFQAHLMGIKWFQDNIERVTLGYPQPTPCWSYSDCKALAEMKDGTWHCDDITLVAVIQQIREVEHSLRQQITFTNHWIPRAENHSSDALATQGLRTILGRSRT